MFCWDHRSAWLMMSRLRAVPPCVSSPRASRLSAGVCESASARWPSLPPLRDPGRAFPIDLYLQHRSRKRLVNPFSLRPLICSYLLQHPKKSRGIFPSLLPIDSALRKSALLSKHYWSPSPRQLLHQCIKGLDELKFHFRQLVPFIFCLFFEREARLRASLGVGQ